MVVNSQVGKDKAVSIDRPFLTSNDPLLSIGVLIVITAGVAMRLVALGEHPYGLYQDEAYYGLDALAVLSGGHALYFAANHGREPLFIYLVAATVSLFGQTPLGIRAASAILGLLTIPATYLLGRIWAGKRVGLIGAGIISVTLWPIHLSRVGFRAASLPLFSALVLWLGALALKRRSCGLAIIAGLVYGLSAYTYLAVRFTPLALAGMLAYSLIWHRDWWLGRGRLLAWMAAPAVLVMLPLGWLAITQPDLVLGRSGQVAIWNRPDFGAVLVANTLHTLGMFTWRGDAIWRHNVPGRPVFDPLLSLAFLAGVILSVFRWRQRPALALALVWVGAMLLPTLLADDAPHFLRAVGVLPVVVLIPALAMDAGLENLIPRLSSRVQGGVVTGIMILTLAISAGLTARDYFGCRPELPVRWSGFDYVGCYRTDLVRGYFFQAEATSLAREINAAQGVVVLDRRFWETFPSVRFLITHENLVFYQEGARAVRVDPPMSLFAWPHEGLEEALGALPAETEITVSPGPETRGDLDPAVYRLYVRYSAVTIPTATQAELSHPLARFANGIILAGWDIESAGGIYNLSFRWAAEQTPEQPVRVFVHLVDANGAILSQIDEPPGTIYYPPLSWQPGSVIIHRASLAVAGLEQPGVQWQIGLYEPATGTRVSILESGMAQEDKALILMGDWDSTP